MKPIIAFALVSLTLGAQTPVNPVTAKDLLSLPVIANASFQVNCMNMNFSEQSYLNTSQDYNNIQNQVSNCLTGYGLLDKSFGYLVKGAFTLSINGAAASTAISMALSNLTATFASENVQYRYFAFYLPVSAPYAISVSLPGDIVFNPNNKFELYSADYVYRWSAQLSADANRTFTFDSLPAGPYICMVGLGSTSSYFHSAGNITQIQLQSPTPVNWSANTIVAMQQMDGATILPNVGNNTTVSVPFLPVPTNQNIISGTVSYSDFLPGGVYGSYSYVDTWCWKGSPGRWILYPQINATNSYISGGSAFYNLTRAANEYEYVSCSQ